jgi:magnesium chelatase subunit D
MLAESERRKGRSPFVVILSDGRGNIAFDGSADRARAEDDARAAARRLRTAGCTVLFFDTTPRPSPRAQALSKEIGARYSALPYAASAHVSRAVQQAVAAASLGAGR